MRITYLIFISVLLLFVSCTKDSDLLETLQQDDIEALEAMHESFEMVLIYNDSLKLCFEDSGICSTEMMAHLDNMFHQFEALYDTYHAKYSHHNITDDHHHSAESPHNHGSVHHQEGEHHDEGDEEHEYEHNVETYQEMMALRKLHIKYYHP